MSYIIKKQKFYNSFDKIKEVCQLNNYQIPIILRDYETLKRNDFKDKNLQDELESFLKTFPEFGEIALNLNEEQEEIVTYDGDKFLSVEAGPGAGKTRVLIEKVNYMVNDLGVNPETLLIITFSHKAAEELQERLSEGDLLKSDVQYQQFIHSAGKSWKKVVKSV